MQKTINFSDKDADLIKRLERYKKKKGYTYLVDVVRELCDDALTLKEIVK
ncbi:MAG: hypothetical protein NC397_10135 [Clostridium sp.]|nr:hypothetical protein [Clostridium sp.]